ncbi:hypothetical protein LPJ68_005682 [Coemansia sp. RSA 1086]|nr:hypothetical protein LPJ68_005682 [Coemansia sp. RSA 1086]
MRGKQASTTLKTFVRVSKNAEGALGKDAKPTMRITRSRAAAMAEAKLDLIEPVTPSRKRKLEPAEKPECSPAKRASRTPQKRKAATTTKQGKSTATIKAYFKAKDNEPAIPKTVEPVTAKPTVKPFIEASAEPKEMSNNDSNKDNELEEGAAPVAKTAAPVEAEPIEAPAKAGRSERANSLLSRLRNRKRPEPTAAEKAKIEETRAIQDQIRALREQPATESLKNPSVVSFESSHIKTAEEQQLRELKRQYVKINSAVGSMAVMPREFRKLEELFQALEHTVMFGGANSKGVVYHRIRQAVESMAQRTFGWRELGQILAVFPESYSYKPFTTTHNGRSVQSVILTPVARGMTLALEMESRRDQFKQRLIKLVSNAHTDFMLKRGYSQDELSGISGWHPSFDIETTPTITPLTLPPTTLKDMQASGAVASFDREKLKHLLGNSHKTSKPTDLSASKSNEESKIAVLSLPTPSDSPLLQASETKPKERPTSTAAALLERIRAKQRAKELATKPKPIPVTTQSMYSRLPAILSTLSFIYYSERKHVLPLAYVVDKVCESQSLDKSEATCHLISLAEFVPEWCLIDDEDPKKPSPDARFKVIRSVSTQEAKKRLQAKIDAINQS